MKKQGQLIELKEYLLENSEYLLEGGALEKPKSQFVTDHDKFKKYFNKTIDDLKIFKKSDDSASPLPMSKQVDAIIQELSKLSRTEIRDAVLQEYHSLCASLRVLNLFFLYQKFFLSPFDKDSLVLLEEILGSNPGFRKLNQTFVELFQNADRGKSERTPSCKGLYYSALKGIDYLRTRTMEPSGIEVSNFRELSHFFEVHPFIRKFFDDNLTEIMGYAIILYGEKSPSLTYQKPPEDIKKLYALKKKARGNPRGNKLSAGLFKPFVSSPADPDVATVLQHAAVKKRKLNSAADILPAPSAEGSGCVNGL